jgi:outer membrane receptor protein involved in Fe transport
MNRTLPYLLSLLGLASITSASAQELTTPPPSASPAPTSEEVYVLDDFVVSTADDKGYYSANSISATRTNELVKNTPITLTVVNEQLMEDLNILNDQDLDQVTASVSRDPDGFSENRLRIRGFRSLTQRYDLFWRELERDGYNIQRADIVKGANSLMYGQADPGGLINSVPKMAQHNKDFTRIKGTVGNKDHVRAEFDANYVVNDDLAVRFMGMDMSRDLDQLYEFSDKTGGTVELSYRPTNKTHLRAHLEHMDLHQSFAPGMFQMTTGDNRFAANSYPSETDNREQFSLGAYRNEFLYSPDAIDLIPDAIIKDLELNPDYVEDEGIEQFDPNDAEKNRAILKEMMGPSWSNLNIDDRYSISGPDSFNRRKGKIITADWTQAISDQVQFKLAVNREDVDRNSRSRAGYSNKRILASEVDYRVQNRVGEEILYDKTIGKWDPYIETYWRKIEGNTKATALKATLLYEFEADNSIFVPGSSKHKLLLGTDYDHLQKDPKEWHQLKNDPDENGYFESFDYYKEVFSLAGGFGPEVPAIGYNGHDDLWKVAKDDKFDSKTESAWFAFQSEFLDGRLRSLAGLRHDSITIKFDSIDYFKKGSRAKQKLLGKEHKFTQVSPTIGALYWLNSEVGLFANYAESIQSPTGLDLDPLGRLIPPVTGEGYEYGLRFDLFEGKLNGQIAAFYIEKENDDIVNYDWRLRDIYTKERFPQEEYAAYFNNNGILINDSASGKKLPGDISRAEGVECEFYYNPNRNLSFIFSYTYNNLDAIKIAATEIDPDFNERFAQVWGQAPHNALLIGRYKFTSGALKGLTMGANQSFRSSSSIGEWYIEDDGDAKGEGTWHEVKFDPEYVTSAFLNYERKLGKGRGVPVLNLGLRVNNLFDDTDLINRNKGAFHRASRQYLLSANLRF